MTGKHESDTKQSSSAFSRSSLSRYISEKYGDIVVQAGTIRDDPAAPGLPPFKGLLPYVPSDAPIFHGREGMVTRLVRRLQENHFLALVGASGSGKSSLIGAGLTPALQKQNWLVCTFTPTGRPLHSLAATLLDLDPTLATAERLVSTMVVNPHALSRAGTKLVADRDAAQLLLVVDQFEELFTLCTNEAERRAFLATLLATAAEQANITILISLNASFYDRCLQCPRLRSVLVDAQEVLAAPADEQLLQIIAEPARSGKWLYVEGLIEHIVEGAGRAPDQLPLLSQALLSTWRQRQGRIMTFAGYRESGGLERAIAHNAEQTLDLIPSGQVELAKKIFLRLVDPGQTVPHAGRSATITELTSQGRTPEVASVITRLVRARLLTVDGGQVKISHEALLTHWPRLGDWMAEQQERRRFEQLLAHDAQTWEALDHNPRALYQGTRLAHARAWRRHPEVTASLPELSRRFLDASEQREAVEARREETDVLREQLESEQPAQETPAPRPRTLIDLASTAVRRGALVGALLVLLVLALVAGVVGQQAIVTARREARTARAGELAALSSERVPQEPLAALSYAWQAVDETYAADETVTAEARAALLRALTLPTPVKSFQAHRGPVTAVAFHPAGDRILTASLDGSARLWDLSGNQLANVEGAGWGILSAGFSPDGNRIYTLDQDGTVHLWDLQGNYLTRLEDPAGRILVAAFHPASDRILTASQAGTVGIWDTEGNQLSTLPQQRGPVVAARWNPAGDLLLTASGERADLWDLAGNQLATFQGHSSGVTDVNFSPDGTRVVSASYDRSARVWDLQGRQLAVLSGHEDVIWTATFGPDGEGIATGSGDRTVHLWKMETELETALLLHKHGVSLVRYHPVVEQLLTITWDGNARLWDWQGNLLAHLGDGEMSAVDAAEFNATGSQLVTGESTGYVRIWEMVVIAPEERASARARLEADRAAPSGVEEVAGPPALSDDALWAAGRARLLNSPSCQTLFDVAVCGSPP